MVDWQKTWDEIVRPHFQELISAVKAEFPEIHGSSRLFSIGEREFNGYASFMFGDPANADEDLIARLTRGPALGFAKSKEERWLPNAHDRDAINLEVWGPVLFGTVFELEPLLLPEDDESAQYEKEVMDYIDKAMALLRQRTPDVIEALGRLKASRPPPGPPLPRVRPRLSDSE